MRLTFMGLAICAVLAMPPVGWASDPNEHTGRLESRPEGKVGTWVVGGRKVEATEKTQLEDEYGPIRVGGCVVVEFSGKRVAFIKSEEENKCK
jgi:hypothetical protein